MAKPKYPKQFRVTFDRRSINVRDGDSFREVFDEYPLGYAIEYAPNTITYAKQLLSQNQWAYGKHTVDDAGKITLDKSTWSRTQYVPLADDLHPQIIDNVPMDGFRVQSMVSRSGSHNNKLWRILDPRGFELEIGSGAMEDLIMGGTIEKGMIVGTCIWRTPKILVRV